MVVRDCALAGILGILATSSACTPKPKQRSWVLHTESQHDDLDPEYPRYATYADVEQRRAAALETRDGREALRYLRMLGRFLWEIEPLLASRDRIAGDREIEYAEIDRDALVAEAEAFVAEFEAAEGLQPYLWSSLAFVAADCESVSVETAIDLSCWLDGPDDALDIPKAVCGEVTTVCRATLDRMVEPESMYWLMKICAKSMTRGTDRSREQALATWLSPSELEFWREMGRGQVRAPDEVRRQREIYTTVFDNQCDEPVRVKGVGEWQTVAPRERVTVEVRRCRWLSIDTGTWETMLDFDRPLWVRLEADCKDLDWVMPPGP